MAATLSLLLFEEGPHWLQHFLYYFLKRVPVGCNIHLFLFKEGPHWLQQFIYYYITRVPTGCKFLMHRLPPLAGAWTVAMLCSCNAALVALVALAVLTVLFLGFFFQGFSPFGKVVKGMDVVLQLYSGYSYGLYSYGLI